MLKKVLLGSVLIGISSSLFAGTLSPFLSGGLYGGAEAGYNTFAIDNKITVNYGMGPQSTVSMDNHADSGIVGLYAGYGKLFQSFYLGLEVDGLLNSAKTTIKSSNIGFITAASNINEKFGNNYGIDLMPGYAVASNVLIYGKLGVRQADFDSSSIDASYFGTTGKVDKTLTGAQFGLGMEVSLNCHWSIRGEYDYIAYQNFSRNSVSPLLSTPMSPATVSTHYHLNQQQALVGLTYHFDGMV